MDNLIFYDNIVLYSISHDHLSLPEEIETIEYDDHGADNDIQYWGVCEYGHKTAYEYTWE